MFMRKLICCAASVAALIFAANAADTATPKKKVPAPAAKTTVASKAPVATAPKTAVHKSVPVAPKTGVPKQAATRTVSTGTRTATAVHHTTPAPKRPITTWRNRQAAPTPDRYKEIQEALATKGYLQPGDATGRWDQASVEAMKRFQAEQKLDSTGKINSLSLIALGLGPKHESPSTPKLTEQPNGQQ
jgi:hypothetical protein